MKRTFGLSMCLLLAVGAAGCEEEITCASAVQHFYAAHRWLHDGEQWFDNEADAMAFCEGLAEEARQSGCGDTLQRWLGCLRSAEEANPGDWGGLCVHEQSELEACIAGEPFERDCADGEDGDGDGDTDCFDSDCLDAIECFTGWYGYSFPQSATRAVDLLFVIDNSGSMAGEQANLRTNYNPLPAVLWSMLGGMPNLHIGVTSTDLGVGANDITYCDQEGDGGRLLKGGCANPTGVSYIIDVEPQGCEIVREPYGACSSHDCTEASCAHEPYTTFVEDSATGCPRCRNYQSETLADVFSCIADLGTMGCGFEQPLEALYQALQPDNTANTGFLREDAILAVILLTDEDDCSASDTALFDRSATAIDSPYGPLTSFRCFEFGVTCDINDRTTEGTRQECVPREDPGALLHPTSRYTQFLRSIKDPEMMVVAAIGGPVTPSPSGVGHNMVVGLDDDGYPDLQYSCTTAVDGAVPGIRIFDVVSAFNEQEDLDAWAYASVCNADYSWVLQGIGNKLADRLDNQCYPTPLKGCADPAVEHGLPGDGRACNDVCLPTCVVGETQQRGTAEEQDYWVPHCLEVCPSGFCEGNTDRSQAYQNGHPVLRDPDLPVERCWHVTYNEYCARSNYADIVIARRADPPPRTFARFACNQISRDEQLCNDGVDNDEDCLVDLDDPCCQNPANCQD
ncbi:MAG: hypothetical protein ABI333_18695 [bacterium]